MVPPSVEQARAFAADRVRPSFMERYEAGVFSRDLWRAMGEAGLLGAAVPVGLGGSGGRAAELSSLLRAFTAEGCDLGLSLSWITHTALCIKSIESFGTAAQRERYIPRLAAGELVGAAAISEPGGGAHPGMLRTTAERTPSGYVINGRKVFVTDGPSADLLIVLAVSGEDGEKLEVTAFLIETATEGVSTRRMDLDFLKTCPHAEIFFEGVEVGDDAVLGRPGEGHSGPSRAAFARERSLVLGALPGLFSRAASELAAALPAAGGRIELEGTESYSWIHHLSALEAYERLSEQCATEAFERPGEWGGSMGVALYLGMSYSRWASWVKDFASSRGLDETPPLSMMLNDLRLVSVGEGLLLKEGRRRYLTGYGT